MARAAARYSPVSKPEWNAPSLHVLLTHTPHHLRDVDVAAFAAGSHHLHNVVAQVHAILGLQGQGQQVRGGSRGQGLGATLFWANSGGHTVDTMECEGQGTMLGAKEGEGTPGQ